MTILRTLSGFSFCLTSPTPSPDPVLEYLVLLPAFSAFNLCYATFEIFLSTLLLGIVGKNCCCEPLGANYHNPADAFQDLRNAAEVQREQKLSRRTSVVVGSFLTL